MQLKITLRSAEIFKSFTFFSKMHLYAVAAVAAVSDSRPSSTSVQTTAVDTHSGATPFWCSSMDFKVEDEEGGGGKETLAVCVKCRRSAMMGSDKRVGIAEVPVTALLDYHRRHSRPNLPASIALTVMSKSGKPRGVLYMSFMFNGGALPVPRPAPSAPPLEECEGYGSLVCAPAVAVVPSAPPYLPSGEIVLH